MSDLPREPLSTGSDALPPTTGSEISGQNEYPAAPTGTFSSSGSGSGSGSKVDTAKGEAKQVAGTAVDSGREVAATAKGEAQNVVAETKQQARSLLETVRSEVGEQAGTQQNRVADALHSLSRSWAAWRPARRSPGR